MRLFDDKGCPIPTKEEKYRAEEQLKEFIEKNKKKFEDWAKRFGPINFPIKYDLDKQRWAWLGKE